MWKAMDEILGRLEKLKKNGSKMKYDEMLLDLIPYLKYFQYVQGGEGKAYFIGKDYVVKEYSKSFDMDLFDKYFETYCREIQGFSKKELVVPKIYSWNSIPQVVVKRSTPRIQYNYYIMEERIKGRPIFSGLMEDVFHLCADICQEKQFNNVVFNPYMDGKLYNEIVKRYIDDYILMNRSIESLSESDIEKFVMSVYQMFEEGENSSPDMYPSNVILSPNSGLFMIDNHLISKKDDVYYNSTTPEEFTLTGLLFLFLYNEQVADIKHHPYFITEGANFDLEERVARNGKACESAIKKIMKVTKKCISSPVVFKKNILLRLHAMLKNILGKDKANEIVDIMQK